MKVRKILFLKTVTIITIKINNIKMDNSSKKHAVCDSKSLFFVEIAVFSHTIIDLCHKNMVISLKTSKNIW